MNSFIKRVLSPGRMKHPAKMFHPARMLHPAWYHGHDKKPPFFEGWYYKLVDASGQNRFAIIPGMFKSDDPAQHHAFVQVLDGTTGQATYHRFPAEAFRAARDRFEVAIGANRFTQDYLSMQLAGLDALSGEGQTLYGEVHFEGLTPWPVTLISPGIMGWYAWVPTMECYHGVLSMDHALRGALTVDGRTIDWKDGRGYMEKDWGVSFPSAWIWLQTNHFDQPHVSLTASVAMIPWRRASFRGMIIGLWHGGRLYRFATYTGAQTECLEVTPDASSGAASSGVERVTWVLRGRPFVGGAMHRLELHATRASDGTGAEGGLIRGPSTADMGVRVAESLSASVEVRLTRLRGKQATLIFEGTGRYAGLEIVGDLVQ